MAVYTTIDNPELYFQVKLWSGTGSGHAITLDGSEDMQPDFIWAKQRSATRYHNLQDAVRGTGVNLFSNTTGADNSDATNITAFSSDGFSVGDGDNVNKSGDTYVAWCWKESADAGFDIVSYAGNGVEGRNISHSLSAVPHLMLVKNRTNAVKWAVYHHKNTAAPETDHLQLNDSAATSDDDSTWDDTAPGSSVFRVKGSTSVNGSSANYIAYLFSEKQGYSKFGSFVGNGSLNGTFCYTGFRPAFVMLKCGSHASSNWVMLDNKKSNPFNDATCPDALYANDEASESTASPWADLVSNGFKCRGYDEGNTINASGKTYVYIAFAEAPFVNSNGVPCNAR